MESLANLFGSSAKVRLMRLFLFNPEMAYDGKEIANRSKTKSTLVRKELNILEKSNLVKRRKMRKGKKKVMVWTLNHDFQYLLALQNLLVNITPFQHKDILKRLNRIGRVRAIILSGVFIQNWDSRADILVVADKIKKRVLETIMKNLEAEVGKEIRYIALSTSEFKYRLSIGDKLVRDVLDYPHEMALDKLGIE